MWPISVEVAPSEGISDSVPVPKGPLPRLRRAAKPHTTRRRVRRGVRSALTCSPTSRHAKCLRRELQREVPRRVLEPELVREPGRCKPGNRDLAPRRQPSPPPQLAWRSDPGGARQAASPGQSVEDPDDTGARDRLADLDGHSLAAERGFTTFSQRGLQRLLSSCCSATSCFGFQVGPIGGPRGDPRRFHRESPASTWRCGTRHPRALGLASRLQPHSPRAEFERGRRTLEPTPAGACEKLIDPNSIEDVRRESTS